MRKSGLSGALGLGLMAVPAAAQGQPAIPATDARQTIIVTGVRDGYQVDATSTATRTPTSLKDVPQAASIITEAQIDDQAMRSIADVLCGDRSPTRGDRSPRLAWWCESDVISDVITILTYP